VVVPPWSVGLLYVIIVLTSTSMRRLEALPRVPVDGEIERSFPL